MVDAGHGGIGTAEMATARQIPNPYAKRLYPVVSGFQYFDDLHLTRRAVAARRGGRAARFIVAADYRVRFTVDGEARTLTVPAGMLTDLTSVPRLARPLVGQVGPHLEAAIVHDFLYVAWQCVEGLTPSEKDWRFANRVMYAAMQAAGVRPWRRTLIRWALEWTPVSRRAFFRGVERVFELSR